MTVKACLLVNSMNVGGAEKHMLTLAGRLDRQVLSPHLVSVKPLSGPLQAEALRAGVPVWSPNARAGLDLSATRRLAAHWTDCRTEVVLAANMYASLMAWMAAKFMRRKPRLLSVLHSSPTLILKTWRQRLQLRAYSFAVGSSFDGLIYVSGLQRAAWSTHGFVPDVVVTHVFNGIEVERYDTNQQPQLRQSFGWSANEFVVGVCASLRPEKRIEDLIAAAAQLVQRRVPIRLLIVGDGPQRSVLERLGRQMMAPEHIVFAGYQRDVASYMHACDAMALVSETEAFSIAVLEAMACAKPLVLTRVGGATEQIEQGVEGYLVDPHSPQQIADRLEELYRGPAAAMGLRGRQRVMSLFSEDRMIKRYEALLSRPWSVRQS